MCGEGEEEVGRRYFGVGGRMAAGVTGTCVQQGRAGQGRGAALCMNTTNKDLSFFGFYVFAKCPDGDPKQLYIYYILYYMGSCT